MQTPTKTPHLIRGFTFVELLIVIAIIGILSAVVFTSLNTARQKARDAKRIAEVGQIKKALEVYYVDNQTYPSTTPSGYTGDDAAVKYLVSLGLMPSVPVPPVGTNAAYIYHGLYDDGTGLVECDDTAPSGTVCSSYEIGMTLERSDSDVLTSDADDSIGAFYGNSSDCTVNDAGPERCYDITK